MIRRYSVTQKIVGSMIILQFLVIGLVITQHSQETLKSYIENEREKAQIFLNMVSPVVNLQLSLGFEKAMAEQLNTIAPGNANVIKLTVVDRDERILYRYRHPAHRSDSSTIALEVPVNDPYTGQHIATMKLLYSAANIEKMRERDVDFQYKIVAIILLGALLLVFAIRKILSPLRSLSQKIRHYNPNNGDCDLTASKNGDEVGQIQNSIVEMLSRISDYSHQLQQANETLEKRVAQRTEELEAANRQLHELSLTDTLTRLPNRRKFNNYFENVWNIYMREHKPLSLIIADIDHFKKINDTYGHNVGDDVLQEVAEVMMRLDRREIDLIARYGGEEFVVLLPGSDKEETMQYAKRLQQHIRNRRFGSEKITITMSFGIATTVPSADLDQQLFFENADEALYEAKEHGRDRIVHHRTAPSEDAGT